MNPDVSWLFRRGVEKEEGTGPFAPDAGGKGTALLPTSGERQGYAMAELAELERALGAMDPRLKEQQVPAGDEEGWLRRNLEERLRGLGMKLQAKSLSEYALTQRRREQERANRDRPSGYIPSLEELTGATGTSTTPTTPTRPMRPMSEIPPALLDQLMDEYGTDVEAMRRELERRGYATR